MIYRPALASDKPMEPIDVDFVKVVLEAKSGSPKLVRVWADHPDSPAGLLNVAVDWRQVEGNPCRWEAVVHGERRTLVMNDRKRLSRSIGQRDKQAPALKCT